MKTTSESSKTKVREHSSIDKEKGLLISDYLFKISEFSYNEEVRRGISLENLSGQLVTFNSIIFGFMFISFEDISYQFNFLVIMIFISMSSALLSLYRFKYKTSALPADVYRKVEMNREILENSQSLIGSYIAQIDEIVRSMKDKNDKVVFITGVSMASFFIALLFLCVSILL